MKETSNQEEIIIQVQRILEERGRKGLELAKKTVLEEKIESEEVREALKYFMTEYWHDVARPALLSLVCEAVGGDPEKTTAIAIPMSLISGAIDIHDDIIDQSKSKGSRPTVFGKFGKEIALLAGDALLFKGFSLLQKAIEKGVPAEKVARISHIIKKTFFELGDAEALELKFRRRIDVTPEEYLRVIKKKAADVEGHTRISAILGNATNEEIEALGEYGRLLGMLIILRDEMIDTIDIKETVHRIKQEHLSLPILYALQNSKNKKKIYCYFLKDDVTEKDAEKILEFTNTSNGFDMIEELMQGLAREAHVHIEKVEHNKKYLSLILRGMLLPEWKTYLNPPRSNR